LQLQAPPLAEDRLLRAAHMFQSATDWHTKRPQLVLQTRATADERDVKESNRR
jgi:hypothetical protein